MAWALPVPEIPPPTGPHAIGEKTYYWIDSSREETFTEAPNDHRELRVRVWYPAREDTQLERARWLPNADSASADLVTLLAHVRDSGLDLVPSWLWLPSRVLSYLGLARTWSREGAASAPGGPHPLLLFSHGLYGFPAQNMALVQELVSHGYVVAGIQHSYTSVGGVLGDGRRAQASPRFYDIRSVADHARLTTEWIEIWTRDASFTLDMLLESQLHDIDPARIGMFGHSFGGGNTALTCARDSRVRVGVNLDGMLFGPARNASIEQPFLMLLASTAEWRDPPQRLLDAFESTAAELQSAYDAFAHDRGSFAARVRGESRVLRVQGSSHFDFSDAPFAGPLVGLTGVRGQIAPERMHRIQADSLLTFFDRHLEGDLDASVDATVERHPELVPEGEVCESRDAKRAMK